LHKTTDEEKKNSMSMDHTSVFLSHYIGEDGAYVYVCVDNGSSNNGRTETKNVFFSELIE